MRKVFSVLGFALFVVSLVVMYKTYPSVRDGPTIKGSPPPPQQQQQQQLQQQQQQLLAGQQSGRDTGGHQATAGHTMNSLILTVRYTVRVREFMVCHSL